MALKISQAPANNNIILRAMLQNDLVGEIWKSGFPTKFWTDQKRKKVILNYYWVFNLFF